MAWAAYKRKGFFLADAAVACFVAAVLLAAIFSTLFVSGAVVRKLEQRMKHERLKREVLTTRERTYRGMLPEYERK